MHFASDKNLHDIFSNVLHLEAMTKPVVWHLLFFKFAMHEKKLFSTNV